MSAPFGYLTINKAQLILMRQVLRAELAHLDREASNGRLREVLPKFQEMMLTSLQAGALRCTAFDDETGRSLPVTLDFWHSKKAMNSLRLGTINIQISQKSDGLPGEIRSARIFIEEETFWLLVENIDRDLAASEEATKSPPAADIHAKAEVSPVVSPSGAQAPRRRGPKDLKHQRICAEMRLIPAEELDNMPYKEMKARFKAAESTCEIARKIVQKERITEKLE